MKKLFFITLIIFSKVVFSQEIVRDNRGLPICFEDNQNKISVHFSWVDSYLTRDLLVSYSLDNCKDKIRTNGRIDLNWNKITQKQIVQLPKDLQFEIKQWQEKASKIRETAEAKKYIEESNITDYTLELNRSLSRDYGQMFSARVFQQVIESKVENKNFKEKLKQKIINKKLIENRFSKLKDNVVIVVSFGLGWEERYNKTAPFYLKDFIYDIKSLGIPVVFLKRNAFGTVHDNIEKITPQLLSVLKSGKEIIFVSLCKGTPELMAAEANVLRSNELSVKAKILGHVNLSGMLGGAFFSDYSKEVVFPKLVAPLLKLIPTDLTNDSAQMIEAIDYMKNSIIETTVRNAIPEIERDRLYINVTGAPMSNQVLENKSPMIPILKYNFKKKLIDGASDGFLELPKTLIPQELSNNQLTLVLDSSHLLSDGEIDGIRIDDKMNRRILYNTIIEEILIRNSISID